MFDQKRSELNLPTAPSPLERIRARTCDCHERLEAHMDWQQALGSVATYRRMLTALANVVVPLDERIASVLQPIPPGYAPLRRARWLEQDLRALDRLSGTDETVKRSLVYQSARVDVSFVFDQASAIGALYVLEGSALGGQILSRQLQTHLSLDASQGGSYLMGLGERTAMHWREFIAWMNAQLSRLAGAEAAAEAAREAFHRFGEQMGGWNHE